MSIGRMYTATFEEVAATAAQDLFEVVSAADSVTIIHSFEISQSSDPATDEHLNILVHRGSTSGSAGSSVTPSPLNLGDAAFGGTVEANNTTQGTEGTILHSASFNIINGYISPAEFKPICSPSGRIIIELQTTPADSLTISGTVLLEEIGG